MKMLTTKVSGTKGRCQGYNKIYGFTISCGQN